MQPYLTIPWPGAKPIDTLENRAEFGDRQHFAVPTMCVSLEADKCAGRHLTAPVRKLSCAKYPVRFWRKSRCGFFFASLPGTPHPALNAVVQVLDPKTFGPVPENIHVQGIPALHLYVPLIGPSESTRGKELKETEQQAVVRTLSSDFRAPKCYRVIL